MPKTIYQVDAFANRPFEGNPAAVCLLTGAADEKWMQEVAGEMNLSETSFLWPEKKGYRLRWFTPTQEVDLCGHATLASAHILWETGDLNPEHAARFYTRSGGLTAAKQGDRIEMDFPSEPPESTAAPAGLLESLGVAFPRYVGRNRMDYLIEVATEEEVRQLSPDFARLRSFDCRGVIVTSRSGEKPYDFVSRFFAPQAGVNEDPVTGSAHCCLGPFWGSSLNKTQMLGFQASPRGGEVGVRLEKSRVKLIGKAVTVLSCQLHA